MRAIRRILLTVLLAGRFLGYDQPSPRMPGERKGPGRSRRCTRCGGPVRKTSQGGYSCLECGSSFNESPRAR
jgi:hypothetical protein